MSWKANCFIYLFLNERMHLTKCLPKMRPTGYKLYWASLRPVQSAEKLNLKICSCAHLMCMYLMSLLLFMRAARTHISAVQKVILVFSSAQIKLLLRNCQNLCFPCSISKYLQNSIEKCWVLHIVKQTGLNTHKQENKHARRLSAQ